MTCSLPARSWTALWCLLPCSIRIHPSCVSEVLLVVFNFTYKILNIYCFSEVCISMVIYSCNSQKNHNKTGLWFWKLICLFSWWFYSRCPLSTNLWITFTQENDRYFKTNVREPTLWNHAVIPLYKYKSLYSLTIICTVHIPVRCASVTNHRYFPSQWFTVPAITPHIKVAEWMIPPTYGPLHTYAQAGVIHCLPRPI